ncbi:GXWXG domain-containing protein [Rubellimicrobium arenae]|uniref:GXWXG domain-containing protein n=1 Tax=Rubellimicrobium arenae TaxID=2817372 RepID=UPI001B31760A|nr:GXWXG domain-containing protein [Rubellimicrobium arenae]
MVASGRFGPGWLAHWQSQGISPREALDRFVDLPGADPAGLTGVWLGRTLPTGHPLDGLLDGLGWHGKEILADGRVHPLLFRHPSGQVEALEPAWMPAGLALRWPALAHSPVARMAFRALSPLLRARGPAARVEPREFQGRDGVAVVYLRQPIVDHLRQIDAARLIGLMERRGMARPFFFLLSRDAR